MEEKYHRLSSVNGPANQLGIALKSTSQLTLEDMTEMLSLEKGEGGSGYWDYEANISVNINGKPIKEEDIIKLRVFEDARVEIFRQANYPMKIEEIDAESAWEIARKMNVKRSEREGPVVAVYPTGDGSMGQSFY